MEIRPATSADGDAIREIAERSMEASYSLSPSAIVGAVENWYSVESLDEKFEDEDVLILVAEQDDELVAFSESTVVADQGDILWLHVDPMYRGEGIGDTLYEETRDALTEHGATNLRGRVLADNAQGNDFYEDHGLTKTGEGHVDIDGTDYIENIYTDADLEDLETITGPDGQNLYVDHVDTDRGSKGPFHVVYSDADRSERWGFYCGNCENLVTSMDTMGRMECDRCGNQRKPTRWDSAYM